MERIRKTLGEHCHFLVITSVLTLVVTFPTIVYVFRTDVFWLPTGTSTDAYIKLWDMWYGGQMLAGKADRFYTELMFYPNGVSLTYHPLMIPQVIVVSVLKSIMPVSNAFSLSYLMIVFTTALSAYVYLLYLVEEKWIALFGAVMFGFSPHVVGHPNHPDTAFIATLPLALYFFHRGVLEYRSRFIIVSGLLTGLTTVVIMYAFVCLLLTLGLYIFAFAVSRWHRRSYWKMILILMLVVAASGAWRVFPMISDSNTFDAAVQWHREHEVRNDLISNFVNHNNPILGPVMDAVLQTPEKARISATSYLGLLPMLLIGFGLLYRKSRRQMLPWLALGTVFLILRLGPLLHVNGSTYHDIRLPKYYLNQLLPFAFASFSETDNFMMGALLPLAVLSCFGLVALCRERRMQIRPLFVLLLIAVLVFEYYVPIRENVIGDDQTAFHDWLAGEDYKDIRLVNVPMGRDNSKIYNLYQSLSGYPHAEGAISRTPHVAFDYIRGNHLLTQWYGMQSAVCGWHNEESYLAASQQLEDDGFTHVVFHRTLEDDELIADSFLGVDPSYEDAYVSIYRMGDLRDSCPSHGGAAHKFTSPYSELLLAPSIVHERPGIVLTFHPSRPADPDFLRLYGLMTADRERLVQLSHDTEGHLVVQSSSLEISGLASVESSANAFWIVNDPRETVLTEVAAYREWLARHFKNCRRFVDRADGTINLYISRDFPCEAVGESSELGVLYDNGDHLHNFYLERDTDGLRLYLVRTAATERQTHFSLQLFDSNNEMVFQNDGAISGNGVSAHDVDISSLSVGSFEARLILYDYETGASHGGIHRESGERFERALEVATIDF